jgi:hypothetical protein
LITAYAGVQKASSTWLEIEEPWAEENPNAESD